MTDSVKKLSSISDLSSRALTLAALFLFLWITFVPRLDLTMSKAVGVFVKVPGSDSVILEKRKLARALINSNLDVSYKKAKEDWEKKCRGKFEELRKNSKDNKNGAGEILGEETKVILNGASPAELYPRLVEHCGPEPVRSKYTFVETAGSGQLRAMEMAEKDLSDTEKAIEELRGVQSINILGTTIAFPIALAPLLVMLVITIFLGKLDEILISVAKLRGQVTGDTAEAIDVFNDTVLISKKYASSGLALLAPTLVVPILVFTSLIALTHCLIVGYKVSDSSWIVKTIVGYSPQISGVGPFAHRAMLVVTFIVSIWISASVILRYIFENQAFGHQASNTRRVLIAAVFLGVGLTLTTKFGRVPLPKTARVRPERIKYAKRTNLPGGVHYFSAGGGREVPRFVSSDGLGFDVDRYFNVDSRHVSLEEFALSEFRFSDLKSSPRDFGGPLSGSMLSRVFEEMVLDLFEQGKHELSIELLDRVIWFDIASGGLSKRRRASTRLVDLRIALSLDRPVEKGLQEFAGRLEKSARRLLWRVGDTESRQLLRRAEKILLCLDGTESTDEKLSDWVRSERNRTRSWACPRGASSDDCRIVQITTVS